MFLRHTITIVPENIPETSEDICFAVAKYCGENSLTYEFEVRDYPVIARINGRRYEITKQFAKLYRINLWVLRCRAI